MKNLILAQLLPLVLPFLLGQVATVIVAWLKAGIASLNAAPDVVKRSVLLAVSFVLGGIAHVVTAAVLPGACTLGDPMQCLQALADPNAVTVILTALVAHVLHKDRQDKAPASVLGVG